jgi:choline dehydrogenase-like flavoprotein
MFRGCAPLLIDRQPPETPVRADICVIGGGPAGIAIALRLAREPGLTVCLVESGGLTFDETSQELARADTVGAAYYPLKETRVRALGGTSWSWGGVCTILDATAFADRPWVKGGGWPIRRADLAGYLDDALTLCGISDVERHRVDAETAAAFEVAGLDEHAVAPVPVYFSRPVRFGVAYRDDLERAPNLQVLLHTTVTRLVDRDGRVVEATAAWQRRTPFRIQARQFVLASGGVENARMLLVSGLGSDAVGHFFMEHPRIPNRYRIRRGTTPLSTFIGGGAATTLRFVRLSVADERQLAEELLNYHANLSIGYLGQRSRQWESVRRMAIALRPPWNESPYYQGAGGGRLGLRLSDLATAMRRPDQAMISAIGAIAEHPALRRYLEVWSAVEQIPDAANRIELLPEQDELGMPRVRLQWSVGPAEEQTYRRALAILLRELEKLEPGISKSALDEPDPWPGQIVGTWHHEGTTRMHSDPSGGVVDADCRVHGIANLFVAGSSVFPVSGSTSPTVTILQLALRLADHLRAGLATSPSLDS